MSPTRLIAWFFLALTIASCAAGSTDLSTGMTAGQAVQALGQPDLQDSVPDPNGSGTAVTRYTWTSRGKVAIFGHDNRVAQIQELPASAPSAESASAETSPPPSPFDPVQTPLNYVFYPLKLGLAWMAAGINCVAEGECHRPKPQSPDAG